MFLAQREMSSRSRLSTHSGYCCCPPAKRLRITHKAYEAASASIALGNLEHNNSKLQTLITDRAEKVCRGLGGGDVDVFSSKGDVKSVEVVDYEAASASIALGNLEHNNSKLQTFKSDGPHIVGSMGTFCPKITDRAEKVCRGLGGGDVDVFSSKGDVKSI
jgi:hypothetical protein